jgi:hypothetical protein
LEKVDWFASVLLKKAASKKQSNYSNKAANLLISLNSSFVLNILDSKVKTLQQMPKFVLNLSFVCFCYIR